MKKLVDLKKARPLSEHEAVNLGSLLVLALYFGDKISHFINNDINDPNHFEMKRLMKVYYKQEGVRVQSFETQLDYGYEYLGLVKRMVLTNLTERMQLVYMSAIKYSLGGAALGPAGTGKS